METSALESTNVENAFSEVLTQIHQVVSKKAMEAGDDSGNVPSKGEKIDIDVSAVKKTGNNLCYALLENCLAQGVPDPTSDVRDPIAAPAHDIFLVRDSIRQLASCSCPARGSTHLVV
ncbi:hypothetical protein F2Q69_00010985 [Brassica cretica]|uniref:Uncharacterized protein n=1 Tax=Brassica cretica TaxID=69181 RepID=A0A8S9QVA9_BRACR|nr:hypothetical protein F2Q69_00010985 [Brassica cretica]